MIAVTLRIGHGHAVQSGVMECVYADRYYWISETKQQHLRFTPDNSKAFIWVGRKGVSPSTTFSALSRDTLSLRAAGSSFLLGPFLFPSS